MPVKSKASFGSLIDSTDDLIWSVDLKHRLTAFNTAFLRFAFAMYGTEIGVESSLEELAPAEMASTFIPFYDRAKVQGPFHVAHSLPDRQILEMAFNPILSEDKITGVSVFAKDITWRRAAEDTFIQAEKKYRDIFEGAIEGIFQSSPDGRVLSLNTAMARMLGYKSPSEFKAKVKNLAQDVWADPEERAKYLQLLDERGELKGYECQCKRTDGKLIWVSLKVRRVNDKDGRVLYYHGFIDDISDHRLAAHALAERELLFRQFFEANGSVMLLIDPASGAIVDANPSAAAYYGYTREQMMDMVFSQVNMLPPEKFFSEWHRAFDKELNHFLFPHRLASGEIRDVEVYSSPVTVAGRQMLISIVHDVTERRLVELELRDSEERFRATFDQAAVGMQHTSFEGKFLRCNKRFAEMLGYAPEEILGLTFPQITYPEDIPSSMDLIPQLLNGIIPSGRLEKRYIRKNGSLVWVRLTTSIQRDGEGRPLHFITLIEDINALKMAERKLAASQLALQASEARYRNAFQTSETPYRAAFEVNLDPSAISRLDDGTYIEVNAEFARVLGFEREEVIGRTSKELKIFPLESDREKLAERLRREHVCRDFKLQFRRKNGEIFWGAISASVIELDGIPHIFASTRDLTASLAAESEIYNLASSTH